MTAPPPDHLDEPRAKPCYEGADDMGEYSQTLPRRIEALEGMLICECPEASHADAKHTRSAS